MLSYAFRIVHVEYEEDVVELTFRLFCAHSGWRQGHKVVALSSYRDQGKEHS